jgi:hypothetical protein
MLTLCLPTPQPIRNHDVPWLCWMQLDPASPRYCQALLVCLIYLTNPIQKIVANESARKPSYLGTALGTAYPLCLVALMLVLTPGCQFD